MASMNQTAHAADKLPKKPAGPGRPNYNLIHRFPLPVTVEALPPLIPHNPLSVLTILWMWLRSTFWQSPKTPVFFGVFSPETGSVHITDEKAARTLWEMGFFGKGSLSRSEPTWLDREKRRKGLIAAETSEEMTRKRRQERKKFKQERAQTQREEIEARLRKERGELNGTAPEAIDTDKDQVSAHDTPLKYDIVVAEQRLGQLKMSEENKSPVDVVESEETSIQDMEHLQLSLEEAFFLAFGLGVLEIAILPSKDAKPENVPQTALFSLFRAYSTFPPSIPVPPFISPADTFVANYAVYHHFRSLGWVIRPGPKFAADWMLYNRGPPFSHAEFAVITVPSYSHSFWKTERGQQMMQSAGIKNGGRKSWHWLHMTNRVQAQVRKSLVLAYVEMPPPLDEQLSKNAQVETEESPTSVLKRMKVREIILKRWVPNRNRD